MTTPLPALYFYLQRRPVLKVTDSLFGCRSCRVTVSFSFLRRVSSAVARRLLRRLQRSGSAAASLALPPALRLRSYRFATSGARPPSPRRPLELP